METNATRDGLFRTLTTIPHRDYGKVVPDFSRSLTSDPDFISRAFAYICLNSKIRDLSDSAIISLLQADAAWPGHREAGRCLLLGRDVYTDVVFDGRLSGVEPFRILRILEYIHSSDHKSSRLMREVSGDWLANLESNPTRFDGVVMRNRKGLKALYRRLHRVPNERVQAVLFDDKPPADSKLAILKQIANSDDVREQVRLVIEHKIPYVVAASVLPKITPAVGVALIGVMTPAEALNSRQWVEQSGLLDVQEVKVAYTDKVAKATASVASAEHRKSAQGKNAEVQAAVDMAKEKATAAVARITRATLVLIDISGSMKNAIAVAQKICERVAPICDDLSVYSFSDYGRKVKANGNSLAAWQEAFRGLRSGGQTNPQAAFDMAMRDGFMPEQIVIVTDGGETTGDFSRSVKEYNDIASSAVNTIMVHVPGSSDCMSEKIKQRGLLLDRFEMTGEDYYAYDQVVALLGGPKAKSIVESIMGIQLPFRSSWAERTFNSVMSVRP